jgi:alpha-aminoadipate carrier protein LysW
MKVVPRKLRITLFVLPLSGKRRAFLFFHLDIEGGKQTMAHCPECDAEITLQGLMTGEIIYCPDCNAELEVLNLEQPAVALAPQVEEDWGE